MLEISDICDHRGSKRAGWAFWIYCPIGIVVLLVRLLVIVLFAAVSALIPGEWRRFTFPVLRRLLGIRVRLNRNPREIEQLIQRKVVAVNHVSLIDYWVAPEIGWPIVLSGTALRKENSLDPFVFRTIELLSGVRFLPTRDKRGAAALFERWRNHAEKTCLYVPAEMTINNGRGLFRFNPTMLCRGTSVVPMALKVTTSLGLVAHPLRAGGLATMLRLLMIPCVRFDVAYLPAQARQPEEERQEFADRIQHLIAEHLGVPATTFTVEDKRAYRQSLMKPRVPS